MISSSGRDFHPGLPAHCKPRQSYQERELKTFAGQLPEQLGFSIS